MPAVARVLGVPTPYLSRRLGLCGDSTDLNALLLEFAGPDIAPLVATALTKYPDLDGQRRAFVTSAYTEAEPSGNPPAVVWHPKLLIRFPAVGYYACRLLVDGQIVGDSALLVRAPDRVSSQ